MNKRKENFSKYYQEHKEVYLKAQKKYDNKSERKEARKIYDKKRYKNLKLANERIKKYKEILDKIKEIIKNDNSCYNEENLLAIERLLEEIE